MCPCTSGLDVEMDVGSRSLQQSSERVTVTLSTRVFVGMFLGEIVTRIAAAAVSKVSRHGYRAACFLDCG